MEDVEIVVTALYDALDRQGITKARFLGPDNHDCVTVYHTPNIDLTELARAALAASSGDGGVVEAAIAFVAKLDECQPHMRPNQ